MHPEGVEMIASEPIDDQVVGCGGRCIRADGANGFAGLLEIEEQPVTSTFNTIDQFGINELKASSIKWICVRAAFLRDLGK